MQGFIDHFGHTCILFQEQLQYKRLKDFKQGGDTIKFTQKMTLESLWRVNWKGKDGGFHTARLVVLFSAWRVFKYETYSH